MSMEDILKKKNPSVQEFILLLLFFRGDIYIGID